MELVLFKLSLSLSPSLALSRIFSVFGVLGRGGLWCDGDFTLHLMQVSVESEAPIANCPLSFEVGPKRLSLGPLTLSLA